MDVALTKIAQNEQRANAWADWLQSDQFAWNRFGTFTTGYELTLKSSRRLMDRYHDRLNNHVFDGNVKLFWVAERFEAKDGYHCHGLLQYDPGQAKREGWDEMEVMTESFQIVTGANKKGKRYRVALNRYNKNRAGGRYCAKYLLKRYADFDLLI